MCPSLLNLLQAARAALLHPASHSHFLASLTCVGRREDPIQAREAARAPPPPPIFSISGPFMAIASGRALGPCQAGGRDTGRVTWGCPEGASPSATPGTRSFCRTAVFGGVLHPVTSKFTLCTETRGPRASPKYLARVLQTPQWRNCSTKGPFPCHGTGLNSLVRLWGEMSESWWAQGGWRNVSPHLHPWAVEISRSTLEPAAQRQSSPPVPG